MSGPPDLVIVPGAAANVPEVMETMAAAFDPAFGEAWTREQCLSVLTVPGVWLLLARREAAPAGFALTRVVLDEAELLLFAVQPAQRRRGIGSALLDAVKDTARMRGASRLHLEMRDGNGALALYGAAGFAAVGRRPGYYKGRAGGIFDAITLSFALDTQIVR